MQTLLDIGLSNAVMASVLALLAAVAGFLCRRPAVRHTLWLRVLLKLITPPLLPIPVVYPAGLETVIAEIPFGNTPVELEPGAHRPASTEDEDCPPAVCYASGSAETFSSQSTAEHERPQSSRLSGFVIPSVPALAFTVWLTGMILWFAVAGQRICRFQSLLRFGANAPAPLQEQARVLAVRLGLVRCPTVWVVPGRVSPLLWALGRELYLVLPAELLDRLGPDQRESLLAHELAHARRRDHWVRWLELAVCGLYWWLPVTWWARRQLQQAEEECCDAWVVWTLPAAAKGYAKALLQTVDFLDARPALPPVASGIGHLHLLKRRLTMIVRKPLYPCLPWPVHVAVIVLGLLVLPCAPHRLVAQNLDSKSAPRLSDDAALVRAEQDPADRDVERRLRILEEKMDRLLQKLEGKPGERFGKEGTSSGEKFKGKEKGEKPTKGERRIELDNILTPEQVDRLKEFKKRFEETVDKNLSPERMEELQRTMKDLKKRIQETVDKNINPERMEEIQRRIDDALKKSSEQLNQALKRSAEQLERAKKSVQQAKQPRADEKSRPKEERDLERRMDRLEEKMDRVLRALEKQGKGL